MLLFLHFRYICTCTCIGWFHSGRKNFSKASTSSATIATSFHSIFSSYMHIISTTVFITNPSLSCTLSSPSLSCTLSPSLPILCPGVLSGSEVITPVVRPLRNVNHFRTPAINAGEEDEGDLLIHVCVGVCVCACVCVCVCVCVYGCPLYMYMYVSFVGSIYMYYDYDITCSIFR